jgi:hypothetical protein
MTRRNRVIERLVCVQLPARRRKPGRAFTSAQYDNILFAERSEVRGLKNSQPVGGASHAYTTKRPPCLITQE